MRKRRYHPNWPYRFVCGLTFCGALIYLALPAYCTFLTDGGISIETRWLSAVLTARDRAMDLLAAWFVFWLGACIGSFLNVVVYRVPRGQTLLGNSMCPHCRQPIRAVENVPILAWIRLRGRCRVCRLPIAQRYMWVELGVALLFFVLGVVELGTGGANLPYVQPPRYLDFAWAIFLPDWRLGLVYLAHASFLATLVAAVLIRFDKRPIPILLWWFAVCLLLVAQSVAEQAHPVSWREVAVDVPLDGPASLEPLRHRFAFPLDALAGALAGFAVSLAVRRQVVCRGSVAALVVSGLCFGWQGLLTTWALASILQLVLRTLQRPSRSALLPGRHAHGTVWLTTWTAAAFVHLLGWSTWHHGIWVGYPAWIAAFLLMAFSVAVERSLVDSATSQAES